MTPTPQEQAMVAEEHRTAEEHPTAPALVWDPERIVISGISGLYPNSHHIKEFEDILYNKINPVTSENLRWSYNHPEAAQHAGVVPDLDRFDAQFFKVHYRLGNCMDPMSRKILEQAFMAIYDAGVNPEQLSGKKIGVFVGSCFSETEKACFYDIALKSSLGITGCSKAMFANRISYWLNAKGPSMSIDEACCSSTAALEQAYLAMIRGDCEGAVVCGAYLCMHPQSSVHYGRIMKQSKDGKTKSFDENADGCTKSEAINVLFLQKAKYAHRIYADVMHAKTEYIGTIKGETGPQYGFLRNPDAIVKFLNKFYEEARVPPHAVEYVEAFGSAVPEADKIELEAIEKVFCKNKGDPLLVGSVISNIGYSEAASGISAITKVLLGYHRGEIAANLHCPNPRQDVEALRDGRMRIVTENQHFCRTYVAVNGMAVTGVNSHVLLHGHYKPKDLSRYQTNIPRLVTISARQDTAVTKFFENLTAHPIDAEELALLHNVYENSIAGHLGRGFIILQRNEEQKTVSLCEKAEYFDDVQRPLWFVYSGMGSQWAGMGAQLMRIPIFAAAIERCRQALEPKGIDIVDIITSPDKKTFDNILHSFVGIAAVQIGLTDVLKELGLVPDGIIGHSVGELGCAYADGCLTAEEMILSAYSRGLVSLQTPFIRGSMAAVGVGFEQVSKLCPPEIEVACHNGPESSTISGPADVMREFVAELTAKGIFAKEVPCSNIAYHSRYIADAGPSLLKYLTEVIKNPRARSERWVSTSVPEERWGSALAKTSSAEYHTNNLLNPVLFEETLKHIPINAVLVEVAPHGLLQAILKRSLPSDCKNIPLTRRGHPDNVNVMLEAIGKLYMEGYNPKIKILYPKVEMPVSTGTPYLSPMIEWAHGEKWALPVYHPASKKITDACTYTISFHDTEHAYLQGHVIRGKTLFPFAATLVSVWDTLAMTLGVPKKQLSVEFRDIHLYAQPVINNHTQLKLRVSLQKAGSFEVMDENIMVAKGKIEAWNAKDEKYELEIQESKDMVLSSTDIYDLLSERDFMYRGEFRSIKCTNEVLSKASLEWRENWVTLIDAMLQLNVLRQAHSSVNAPTNIRRICIDVEQHQTKIDVAADKVTLEVDVLERYDFTRCGGVLIENIRYRNLPGVSKSNMALQTLKFIPHFQVDQQVSTSLQIFLQIVAENVNKTSINVIAITNGDMRASLFDEMKNIGSNVYGVSINYDKYNLEDISLKNNKTQSLMDVDLVLVQNLTHDDNMCQLLHNVVKSDTFIVSEEDQIPGGSSRPSSLYSVVASHSDARTRVQLVRWRPSVAASPTSAVTVRSNADLALLSSARVNLPAHHRLFVIATYPAPVGLKDLIRTWRNDVDRNLVYLITVNCEEDNNFFLDELPDVDLAFTVLDHGKWGGEYYIPAQDNSKICSNVILRSEKVSDFGSLKWMQATDTTESGVQVTVHYAGLSNTDIKKANAMITSKDEREINYGMDFSGITNSGERVMGLVAGGAASSQLRARPELLWPVPAHWTLEDAATVPLAYAHALYCLVIKNKLQPTKKVMVHGGAGALGQATIALALAHGCEVFTTVRDVSKKHFLMKLFPELKADHIGSSRDHSFADMVLSVTKGKGCDIVLSSARGDLKHALIKCAAPEGICLDVSQLHNRDEDFFYGMHSLTMSRAYAIIDFSTIFDSESTEDVKVLHRLMSEGINAGYVRPLSRVTYAPTDVTRAFRLLAASRHRGRVLLRMQGHVAPVHNRMSCNANNCHLVLLDEEMFALQFIDRLVGRGARKIHIHHNIKSTAKFQFKLRSWQKVGVQIQTSSNNLNTENSVVELLNDAGHLGSIQGVYAVTNSNKTIKETLFANLDSASRKLCPNLRYFAVINVGDIMFGQPTCHSRAQNKLPATMITLPLVNNANNCDALDAVEHALCGDDTVLVALRPATQQTDLLKQLATVAGVSISKVTPKTATLEELGIQEDRLQPVASFLRIHYNVEFTEAEVPLLTLETLLHVEKPEDAVDENETGVEPFISYVDSDELLATTEMVLMLTRTTGARREDEFDASEKFLCIVPGIEGHHERFRGLCERLKLAALVLQPALDCPQETVRETAEKFVQTLIIRTGIQDNYYLLGYETGALVALEMAVILEERGLTGTVYFLGCEPDEVQTVMERRLSIYKTKEHLQNDLIKHMFKLMAGDVTVDLEQALKDTTSWSQKVEACLRCLSGRVAHSTQYTRELIEAAMARIERARGHVVRARALRSRLVLLRSAPAALAPLALQQHSRRPVAVHQLTTPLSYATSDIRCASIINDYLDPAILAEFESKNICEMYILNPESYMTIEDDE